MWQACLPLAAIASYEGISVGPDADDLYGRQERVRDSAGRVEGAVDPSLQAVHSHPVSRIEGGPVQIPLNAATQASFVEHSEN